jgi:hypothetical protein
VDVPNDVLASLPEGWRPGKKRGFTDWLLNRAEPTARLKIPNSDHDEYVLPSSIVAGAKVVPDKATSTGEPHAAPEGQQPQDNQPEHPGTDGNRPPAATSGGDRPGASAPVQSPYLTDDEINAAADNHESYDLSYMLEAGRTGHFADEQVAVADLADLAIHPTALATLLDMLPRLPNRYILGLADAFEILPEHAELSPSFGTVRGALHRELLKRAGQGDLFDTFQAPAKSEGNSAESEGNSAPVPVSHAAAMRAQAQRPVADLTVEQLQAEFAYYRKLGKKRSPAEDARTNQVLRELERRGHADAERSARGYGEHNLGGVNRYSMTNVLQQTLANIDEELQRATGADRELLLQTKALYQQEIARRGGQRRQRAGWNATLAGVRRRA